MGGRNAGEPALKPGNASTSDHPDDIGRRAVSGIRWVLIVNAITTPLSFVTNLLLGRVSSEALGFYSAVQIFAEGFLSFVVLGGANVFTRFVPALARERRWSFLASYMALVFAVTTVVVAVGLLVFPSGVAALLARFGGPSWPTVACLGLAVIVWAFASFFLYGILDARGATITLRAVVVGFFLASVYGATFRRADLSSSPASYLWAAGVFVYAIAAVVGIAFVVRTAEVRERAPIRWGFPEGFWEAVTYTHLQTLVAFAYTSLSPAIVLLWLDVRSLGFLHAALRFPALATVLPVMMASVLGPAVSAHLAAGRLDDALRQVRRALDGAYAILVPICVTLACFAGDVMRIFGPSFVEHRGLLRILAIAPIAAPMVFIGGGVAVALHAFRGYFSASALYLIVAVGTSMVLVPRWGLTGAAASASAGAAVQHVAVATLLRFRTGFRGSRRMLLAWLWTAMASTAALVLDPGRWAAAGLTLAFVCAFSFSAGIDRGEIEDALRKVTGRG